MFPYPSGAGLHVGHPEGYTATDIVARYKRMRGFNVLHPMGWDAFGLPAEQYAIETGIHPMKSTTDNIKTFRRQCDLLGFSYGWIARSTPASLTTTGGRSGSSRSCSSTISHTDPSPRELVPRAGNGARERRGHRRQERARRPPRRSASR